MAEPLDPKLKEFATDRQWEILEAVRQHGSDRAAARALGLHRRRIWTTRKTVIAAAIRHGYSPEHDMVHPTPDGFKLKGTSTLYDASTGEAKIQWVKTEADKERQLQIFREAIEAMAGDLPRIAPIKPPKSGAAELMACYPVGDHHLGMLSWDKETGADYDLAIGEKLLVGATRYLINATPACNQATVVFLGDFMHYDSFAPVTPTNRNLLDADSRFPKMVRVAIRSMRHLIESAAARHGRVHVIVEIGNHDLASSIFLMECLSNIYEKEPRITIDTSPQHYHYFEFGKCLVMTHHGHGSKMQNLPLIMASDRPTEWGRSKYRYGWTGHVHHSKTQPATSAQDFSGCSIESFRVLCPPDAWASQKGYRPIRDMKAIMLHRDFGEVARHTVNPDMF